MFEQWVLELWYFTWIFLLARLFRVYQHFHALTLTLELTFEYFKITLINIIWIMNVRSLIFHMSIPNDKIFLCWYLTFWPWHDQFEKKNDIGLSLKNSFKNILELLYIANGHFLWQDFFYWYQNICFYDLNYLWNWPNRGQLCSTNTAFFLNDFVLKKTQNKWNFQWSKIILKII